MRFLSKRPKMDDIVPEMDDLLNVMLGNGFLIMDIFILSLFFSLLLFSVLHSIIFSIITFLCSFILFGILYQYFFKESVKRNKYDISK